MLAPSNEATIPRRRIKDIALGIYEDSTDSVAAKRYCCANATERPIDKLPKQNKPKLFIKIA